MKINLYKLILTVAIGTFCSPLCAESKVESFFKADASNSSNKMQNATSGGVAKTWAPQTYLSKNIWSSQNFFVTNTAAIGFLYFSKPRGSPLFANGSPLYHSSTPTDFGEKGFTYNKTCLYEGSFNWKIFSFLTAGCFYTGQYGVAVQAIQWSRLPQNHSGSATNEAFNFGSNLSLNALGLKIGLYFPVSTVVQWIACTPYINLSVGPSWQSWTNVTFTDMSLKDPFVYRQKISANCFFGTDVGFKFQNVKTYSKSMISLVMGCKFNLWGQARNMGKASQQLWRGGPISGQNGQHTSSRADQWYLVRPAHIQTVYQWAPYLGFTLNY